MTQMNFYETEIGLTDIENRRVVAKGQGGGMDLEFGISRCKLLYIYKMDKQQIPTM